MITGMWGSMDSRLRGNNNIRKNYYGNNTDERFRSE